MVDNSKRKFPDLGEPVTYDVRLGCRSDIMGEGFPQTCGAMSSQYVTECVEVELMKSGVSQAKLASFEAILFPDFSCLSR